MGMFDDKHFVLRQEHVMLLKHSIVNWQDDEFGAAEIDPKRPYGDSDVIPQIRDILSELGSDYNDENVISDDSIRLIHKETKEALQIVLSTGTFKTGLYKSDWGGRKWELLSQECVDK